eukprot:2947024-Prymnesium_polylepis.1
MSPLDHNDLSPSALGGFRPSARSQSTTHAAHAHATARTMDNKSAHGNTGNLGSNQPPSGGHAFLQRDAGRHSIYTLQPPRRPPPANPHQPIARLPNQPIYALASLSVNALAARAAAQVLSSTCCWSGLWLFNVATTTK